MYNDNNINSFVIKLNVLSFVGTEIQNMEIKLEQWYDYIAKFSIKQLKQRNLYTFLNKLYEISPPEKSGEKYLLKMGGTILLFSKNTNI